MNRKANVSWKVGAFFADTELSAKKNRDSDYMKQ